MPELSICTIALKAGGIRKVVEGCGLFSIQLGGVKSGVPEVSKIGYFTESTAKNKCTVTLGFNTVNWESHKKIARELRKIVNHCQTPANN